MMRTAAEVMSAAAAGIAMILLAAPAGAQGAGTIAGRVVDGRNGAPVADAGITVIGMSRNVTADLRGEFRIADVPAGRHRIVTRQMGFAPDTTEVDVAASAVAAVSVRLVPSTVQLDPMMVSGTRELERRADGSLTVDALGGAEIRQTRAAHPAGILNRLAGVHVTETSGEGHMMSMRLQVTTAPMYLYLEDGIPTRPTGFFNHNALYEVNLPQAGGVEVIRGPGTALYGSDAIGGIVNVMTRPAPVSPSLEVNAEGGTAGYRRVLATGGGTWGRHGIRADVNVTHSDNWRDDAPFDRASVNLRWDANLGGGWTLRSVAAGSRIDQQDVPAVPKAVYDTAPSVNLAPIAFRTARALRISSALEREGARSFLSITPFYRHNVMGLLPSWQLTYDPQTWDTRNQSFGLLARYRHDLDGIRARVIAGFDVDVSPGSYFARQAVVTRSGPYDAWTGYTDGDVHYDYDVTYRGISPYLQTLWNPVGSLRIDAGLRADFAGYDYETNIPPVSTGTHRVPPSQSVSYSHLSPKVGATVAVASDINLYGSYRHGFRVPSFGQLFTQNSAVNTVGLKPVTVDSWEAGLRGQLGGRVIFQLAAYTMDLTNDILTYVTPQNTREARNAGSSRHRGVELSLGVTVAPEVRLDVAYAYSTHRYLDWVPQAATATAPAIDYSGNDIEQAPETVGNAMLSWSPPVLGGGRLALQWVGVGRYAQDPGNLSHYDGHNLFNLHGNVQLTRDAELFVRVMNVGGTRYAELSSYTAFQRDTYSPGNPRSVFGGLRYTW